MSGTRAGLCCVISSEPLSRLLKKALNSSLAALGYGHDACTFVAPGDLDQQALFVLIEGLDPICIVAADGKSAALLGQAYHLAVPSGEGNPPAWPHRRILPRLRIPSEDAPRQANRLGFAEKAAEIRGQAVPKMTQRPRGRRPLRQTSETRGRRYRRCVISN